MNVVVSAAVPAQPSAPAEETLVPVLDFVGPVAGFAAHRAFVLTEIDPASIMCAMRAVDDPDVRFLMRGAVGEVLRGVVRVSAKGVGARVKGLVIGNW